MTDKTPVRVVFNASNVATGMAEFQSGETVPVSNGGTGLSSIGTAGQVLKVNSAGTGLVFAGEGDISIQNLVAPTNADLSLRTSGTGGIILNDITISDNSISTNRSNDDFFINASGSGTVILENLKVGTGATVTTILDEDNFATNSATALATQQSIKAYIDSEVGAVSTTQIASGDTSVAVTDDGSGTITFTVDGSSVGTYTANGLQLGGSGARVTTVLDEDNLATNSDTALATQQSIKAYIDAQNTAQAITFVGDDSTGTAVNSGETFQITGGTGLTSAVSGDTMTLAIDSTVATLTGSQTLTNKTLTTPIIEQISNTGTLTLPTSTDTLVGRATTDTLTNKTLTNPTINGGTFSGTFTGTISPGQVTTNSIVSNGSNADISIQPSGTGDVIISALRINGTTLDSSDSTKITIAEAVDITGAITTGAITSSGNITSGGSFIIGSADIDETDLEKIDGITNGTVAANKAVIVDGSLDASGFRNLSATGTLTVTGATSLNGGATVLGAITAGSLTTNTISSNGSNADLSIQPSGTGDVLISALRINGTTLDSADSSKVTIAEAVDITGAAVFGSTVTANGGVIIDNITIDGTEIDLASGDLTLDVAGDIILDADNADIILQDNGTEFGRLSRVSSDFVIKSATNNKDIVFKGIDDSSTITALTLDMSEAGAATFNDKIILGTNKEIQFVDTNESIKSDGSKLIVTSGGTAFNLPTADGSNGNALITDGSGTLSFGAVGEKSTSDDTLAVAVTNKRITTTARSIDAFTESFADSVLYYVCTNDHHLDVINMQKISLCHNDTGPFFAHGGIQSADGALPTLSIESSNNIVRLKSVSTNAVGGNVSFYKISLGDNTSTGTNGSVIVSQNTDVDSASESLVSFAHATFRGAKLFVSVNNNAKTEISNFEALVVHDGTEAFISQYNVVNSGSNDLALLTAAIDGDNVVISASGLEPNLRITVHAIMLKDTMTADSSTYANIETIAPVTVSSSETEFDTLEQRTSNGAVYFLVSKNATEGEFAINEIMVAVGTNDVSHVNVGAISTKGTNQLQASTDFKSTAELQGTLNLASTSGANTTVSAYKIKLHAS